jgi:hypothetical protein
MQNKGNELEIVQNKVGTQNTLLGFHKMFGNARQDSPRFLKAFSLLEIWNPKVFHNFGTRFGRSNIVQIGPFFNIEKVLNNRISSRITLQEKIILKKNYGHLKG